MNKLLKTIQSIRIEDFFYDLPDERIARFPVEPRDHSRLLTYKAGRIAETTFGNLPEQLDQTRMLVYNNTRVIHARLFFFKETGARIEVFCLEPLSPADYAQNFQATESCEWLCLVGNLKKWKNEPLSRKLSLNGQTVLFTAERTGSQDKAQRIRFTWKNTDSDHPVRFGDLLEEAGQLPIPPYLHRETEASDETTYQTVFSRIEGSVAAPTAGLHFTPEVLNAIDRQSIQRSEVTLHVGAGTFQPVLSEQMEDHPMHSEFISVERRLIEDLLKNAGGITAVGTTSVRTLESLYWFGYHLFTNPGLNPDEWILDQWYAYQHLAPEQPVVTTEQALNALLDYMAEHRLTVFTASTRLLIAPGFRFHIVNGIVTNFHQPKSTLLLLVSAFLGGEEWKKVYNYALENGFRFLSYGDSSLLLPEQGQ